MTNPVVHSIISNVLTGGAIRDKATNLKNNIAIKFLMVALSFGFATALIAASYFFILEHSTPAVAATGVALEFGVAMLLTWLGSQFWLKR